MRKLCVDCDDSLCSDMQVTKSISTFYPDFSLELSNPDFTLNRVSGERANATCGLRELVDVSPTPAENLMGELVLHWKLKR